MLDKILETAREWKARGHGQRTEKEISGYIEGVQDALFAMGFDKLSNTALEALEKFFFPDEPEESKP